MKKFITALFFLFLPIVAVAQFTNVTATITDPSGQTWNNGKYSATLVNPQPQTPPSINGTRLTPAQMSVSGTMSGSGVITTSIADNSIVVPAGTYWQFTLCPNASSRCQVQNASTSGGSQDLSSTLSSSLVNIFFPASPVSYGYADSEVSPVPNPGGIYYNVTSLVQRLWNGSAWIDNPGGGGGGSGSIAVCTAQSPTLKCLSLAPYYASPFGDTTTTLTATMVPGTTGTVGSCSTFVAHNGILISGAGAAGIDYIGTVISCTGTSLVVSPATSTSVTSTTVVKHDETAAINQAKTDIYDNIGGTIWFDVDGVYLANGVPQGATAGHKFVIPMPAISLAVGTAKPIIFQGTSPVVGYGYTGGVHLKSSVDHDAIIGGYVAGGAFGGMVGTNLFIRDMFLESTSTDPHVIMVDGSFVATLQTDQVFALSAANSTPSHIESAAFIFPTLSNDVRNTATHTAAAGFYTGFKFSEHAQATTIWGDNLHDGFVFDTSGVTVPGAHVGNSISVDYLWCQSCYNLIVGATTSTAINIQNADGEFLLNDLVYDPNNVLTGVLNYEIPYDVGGRPSQICVPAVTGGTNLILNNLTCPTIEMQGGAGGQSGAINFYTNTDNPPDFTHRKNLSIVNGGPGQILMTGTESAGVGWYINNLANVTGAYSFFAAMWNTDNSREGLFAYLAPNFGTSGPYVGNSLYIGTTVNSDGLTLNTEKNGAPLRFCTASTCLFSVDGTTHLPLIGSNNLCQSDGTNCITKVASFTVSGLPSAATSGAGTILRVSDATTFTVGACVGGGSDTMLAVSDGSAWSCH